MAKYFGQIGFAETIETSPGIWREQIVERNYYGDVLRNNRRLQTGQTVNDSIDISNEFSILADPYAYENFHAMRYLTFMKSKWKITSVDVQYPRLTLSVGGLYNESAD